MFIPSNSVKEKKLACLFNNNWEITTTTHFPEWKQKFVLYVI